MNRFARFLLPIMTVLFALGGVAPGQARALAHPRLAGAAMIRALWEAPDPGRTVATLRAEWEG